MQIDIQYRPTFALAVVQLQPGEMVRAESGAMVSMSSHVQVSTDARMGGKGGFVGMLKRSMLGGESFFTNKFTASGSPGEVTLAPALCGDMAVHPLSSDHELFIQGSSFVACQDGITLDTKFQGMKGFFSGENLFFLKATGDGPVVMNAFGGIEVMDLDGELIVDTGHVVAFTSGLDYKVTKASSGWIDSFLSGEGLVLKFSGRGRLWLQSRNPAEYGKSVGALLPPRQE
ncbi:MAG: TIGR00266 family protein [Myxococcales bacterium]|nr:TIGR00266 family protein [Myxococcales bacterium]